MALLSAQRRGLLWLLPCFLAVVDFSRPLGVYGFVALPTSGILAAPSRFGSAMGGRRTACVRAAVPHEESEEDRVRLDDEARARMADHVLRVQEAAAKAKAAGLEVVDRAAWKWAIRQRIWDLLEKRDLAESPRPVHHRIPNFKGAIEANERIAALPEFQAAHTVKVNPDTPQRHIRYLTLSNKKRLLVPQPRLRTGFFSALEPDVIPKDDWLDACNSAGVKKWGRALPIDQPMPTVDLIVIGSVAVDPKTGARLGKGEGFAELEYGMLRMLGVVDESTLIVTSIRDEQLVNDIPIDKMLRHDVPVDVICTPTQVIRTNSKIPKPTGIYWDLLSPEKLANIRVLQGLKAKIERETGVSLPSGPSEVLPPLAVKSSMAKRQPNKAPGASASGASVVRVEGEGKGKARNYDLVLRNLPYAATAEEVKGWLCSSGVDVHHVSLRTNSDGKPSGRAFVEVKRGKGGIKPQVQIEGLSERAGELGGRTITVTPFVPPQKTTQDTQP